MTNKMPLEIERKFLIKMPDIAILEQQPLYMRIEMEQAYLKNQGENEGMRIRKSTLNGKTSYKKTYKKSITSVTRIEIEDDISEQTWKDLLFDADPDSTPIKKCDIALCLATSCLSLIFTHFGMTGLHWSLK